MKFLLRGSFSLICLLISGCNLTQNEWVHRGEWYYVNESSHVLFLEGAISNFTSGYPETIPFRLVASETFCIDVWGDGSKHIPPEVIPCPFIPTMDLEQILHFITIDNGTPIPIESGRGVRNRDNYLVEKTGRSHYRFTYTFTDENIAELMQ